MGDLYKRIYDLCQSKGLSIGKMCTELGISRGNLTELKMGRIKTLKPENLAKISGFFGVTIDYLLGTKENAPAVVGKRTGQSNIELSHEEIDLIFKYRCLDERGKSAVLNTLEHEYAALPGGKAAADPRRA